MENKELNNNKKEEKVVVFKKLRDLDVEEIKTLTKVKATLTTRVSKQSNYKRYTLTIHLVKDYYDIPIDLTQVEYNNILLRNGIDVNIMSPICIMVYARASFGKRTDGTIYHVLEIIVNPYLRKSVFLEDMGIYNLKQLNHYNDFKWEDRINVEVEDVALVDNLRD